MINVIIHDQQYEVLSWEDIGKFSHDLSKKILATGKKYDRLIALARGGVSISQSLGDALAVKKISIVQTEMYTGVNEKNATPVITQPLSVPIKDERILIVDDLADTGETLLFIAQYLAAAGPKDIKTATLFRKPWSEVTPDFYVKASEAWVIFPWEVRESIQTLSSMWGKAGDNRAQIIQNLETLGFTKDQIETFLQA